MAIFTMYERFYYRYFKFNIERSLRFGWDSFEIFMAISNLSRMSQTRQGQFLDSTRPGAAGREKACWRARTRLPSDSTASGPAGGE